MPTASKRTRCLHSSERELGMLLAPTPLTPPFPGEATMPLIPTRPGQRLGADWETLSPQIHTTRPLEAASETTEAGQAPSAVVRIMRSPTRPSTQRLAAAFS